MKSDREIYNLLSYQKGFSTAVQIDDYEKVSSYIRKYITKDTPIIANKARYWCSQGLKRPFKYLESPSYPELVGAKPHYKTKNWEIFKVGISAKPKPTESSNPVRVSAKPNPDLYCAKPIQQAAKF